jgi:hypothetical protein
MEQVMREIIKSMKLDNAAWIPTKDGDGYQVSFNRFAACIELNFLFISDNLFHRFWSSL